MVLYVMSISGIDLDRAIKTFQILKPDGTYSQEFEPKLTSNELKHLYKIMLTVRMLDKKMLILQRQGRIGFYISSEGEEAAHVGSAYALESNDWIFPAYREPGAALIRGATLKELIAQVYGNAADVNKGRQMPNHWGFKRINYVTPGSPVGAQIPIATGFAIAAKLRNDKRVVLTYFGDGATSTSEFHVGMNFAGVFKAPIIFFCKNNQYAISLPVSKQTASITIAIKAIAYGFQGIRIDGNDILAAYTITKEAVEKARRGEGPTLIEAVTYRLGAHSTSDDPTRYRSQEEVEIARKYDPLKRFRIYLESKGLWSEDDENEEIKKIEEEINIIINEMENTPPPDPRTLFEDVYAEMPWNLREQMELLLDELKEKEKEVQEVK